MKETLEDLRQEVKLLEDLYHTLQFSDKFKESALKIEIILADIQRINKRIEEILQTVKKSIEFPSLALIGKKVRGFSFKTRPGCTYNSNVKKHLGEEGKIIHYYPPYNSYQVQFETDFWFYPAELITEHLID
jgi:hypothetical protein